MKKLTDEERDNRSFDEMCKVHAEAIVQPTAQEVEAERRRNERRDYAVRRYGIKPEEFVWMNNGICYDRIVVNTKEAADKITAIAEKGSVNGGMYHGMRLGGQDYSAKDNTWDVMC